MRAAAEGPLSQARLSHQSLSAQLRDADGGGGAFAGADVSFPAHRSACRPASPGKLYRDLVEPSQQHGGSRRREAIRRTGCVPVRGPGGGESGQKHWIWEEEQLENNCCGKF